MELTKLKALLATAKKRLRRVSKPGQQMSQGEWSKEYNAASDEVLNLEREVALAKGEEAAIPIAWEAPWDPVEPLPHVLSNEWHTFLIYLLRVPSPHWDTDDINTLDPSMFEDQPVVIVEFDRCYMHKFGGPNDEVFGGLPWPDKGLGFDGAHTIENSKWIEEVKRINSVHDMYDSEGWDSMKHYVILFKEEMFECLAVGHGIEVLKKTMREAMEIAFKRLQSH